MKKAAGTSLVHRARRATAAPLLTMIGRALRSNVPSPALKIELRRLAIRYLLPFADDMSCRVRSGGRIRVRPSARLEQEILLFGVWEPALTDHLCERPKSKGIFLDIGANIGYYTIIASERFSEVYAIEALPPIRARLEENVRLNDLKNVSIFGVAVGDREESVEFFLDDHHSGLSGMSRRSDTASAITVPMRPLDAILPREAWKDLAFMKIDVEGCEEFVLDSIIRNVDELQEGIEIVLEYHPGDRDRNADRLWEKIETLLKVGFHAYALQGRYDPWEYVRSRDAARSAPRRLERAPEEAVDVLLTRRPVDGVR